MKKCFLVIAIIITNDIICADTSGIISGYTAWGEPIYATYVKSPLTIRNNSTEQLFIGIKARGSCDSLCSAGKSGPPCYEPTGCCDTLIIDAGRIGRLQKYQDDPVIIFAFPRSGGKYVVHTPESLVIFPDDFEQTRSKQECSGIWDGWNRLS